MDVDEKKYRLVIIYYDRIEIAPSVPQRVSFSSLPDKSDIFKI